MQLRDIGHYNMLFCPQVPRNCTLNSGLDESTIRIILTTKTREEAVK